MPNIKEAYDRAFLMNRAPAELTTPYKTTNVGDAVECVAQFEGSRSSYYTTIILRPSLDDQWHCSCEDFQFTFHYHMAEAGYALAPLPEYETTGKGWPRAIHDFGMCKHVMGFLDVLRSEGHAEGR